jgi:hypothetical protein
MLTRRMTIELTEPDFRASLELDAYAPRAARYHVAQVDRPSPDLRDAIVLLTSELVTRAVERCPPDRREVVELRVWMPSDVVRVELRAPHELLCLPLDDHEGVHYDIVLLGQVADRWSIEAHERPACMWFEIDRYEPAEPANEVRRAAEPVAEVGSHGGAGRGRRSFVRRRRSAGRAH